MNYESVILSAAKDPFQLTAKDPGSSREVGKQSELWGFFAQMLAQNDSASTEKDPSLHSG